MLTNLYALLPAGTLNVNELVVLMPPVLLATFLDERRYLPKGVPLLKHVLALPGQTVCRSDRTITVDGFTVGGALERDHLRRPSVHLAGCRVIGGGDVVLINRQSEKALRPPPSSAMSIHSGPAGSTDNTAIDLSALAFLLSGRTARSSQLGNASAVARSFGSASCRYG